MVDIQSNPLYYATIGGIIIGIATSLNYAFRGNVTGMSGMVYNTITLDPNDMPKNISIIGGMIMIGGIFFEIFQYNTYNKYTPFGPQADITIYTSQFGYALAGFLVGIGTKLANGCTSGHGLCGLARFSIRSFVSVITFLVSGMVIATISYYAPGLGPFTDDSYSPSYSYNHEITAIICIVLGVLLPLYGLYLRFGKINTHISPQSELVALKQSQHQASIKKSIIVDHLILFFTGFIFGCGLLVAGMVRRTNIIRFLSLGQDWNPSLIFVLGCGLFVNLIVFTYFLKVKKVSILGNTLFNPINNVVDWKLLLGSVFFGVGWGIGGLCPGPAIMQIPIFTIDVHLIWFPFMFLGQFVANKINVLTTHTEHPHKHNDNDKSHQKHQSKHIKNEHRDKLQIQVVNPSTNNHTHEESNLKIRLQQNL